jgi:ferredoxin
LSALLNYGDCVGCGLCMIGCPAFEEEGSEAHTAKGRNRMLQAGLAAPAMKEALDACTLCGYCDAVCPKHVENVAITLKLRRDLHGPVKPSTPPTHRLILGCTIRERAPELIPSIREFLRRIDIHDEPETSGCCGAKDVEAGQALPAQARGGIACDPVCAGQYDDVLPLGRLALENPQHFDFKPPFYYFAPHRLINGMHETFYPIYHALREKTGCEMNLDLNRLARSITASAINPKDVEGAVKRLLRHSKAERIITCSPAEYLAFKEHSGRETLFITQCLR